MSELPGDGGWLFTGESETWQEETNVQRKGGRGVGGRTAGGGKAGKVGVLLAYMLSSRNQNCSTELGGGEEQSPDVMTGFHTIPQTSFTRGTV